MSDLSLKPTATAGFRYFRMGEAARLVLAGALFALGAALQVGVGVFPGTLVVLAGWIPLGLRKVTNKPKDQGLEKWKPVTAAEVDRLLDTFAQAAKLRRAAGGRSALRILGGVFLMISVPVSFGISGGAGLVALDALLFLFPAVFFGKVRVFTPGLIAQKLLGFQAIRTEPVPEGFVLTPYIRFDEDEEGRDIPEDLRFLLEPRKKTGDLVGVQFQTAINKGPNGPVPYMYAVVLTRGRKGPAYDSFRDFAARGYEVERGGDEEYGTVVIRQSTGGGGYHTKPDQCRRLFRLAVSALAR